MKKEKLGWEQEKVPEILRNGKSWNKSINQIWICITKNYKESFQVRFFKSPKFSSMTHIIMKKIDKKKGIKGYLDSEEFNYEEKIRILRKLGRVGRIGLEVFPERQIGKHE